MNYLVTHYYHSGFSVACEDAILIFDYWRGEEGELAEALQLKPEFLRSFSHIFVFVSHSHPDHLDPVIYEWKDLPGIRYIVSSDMPVGVRGHRMAPGDTLRLEEDTEVTAFDSTDLGVSFLVHFRGLRVFHAGDLNFWHWRDESTMREIEEADAEFRKALRPLCGLPVDLAFFPLDPRQGSMFEAGADFFILSVKPRIMIPMHYFHRAESAMEYARTASNRSTEVIVMPAYGDRMNIELDEAGYLNLSFPDPEELPPEETASPETDGADVILPENDPFAESDLPLTQLVSDTPEEDSAEPAPETPAASGETAEFKASDV